MNYHTKRQIKTSKNKTKKQFLFNPENPPKSFDVYIDKNPRDTIHIKYTTLEDVQNTINKLEHLYKRLKVLKNKNPEQYALANKYFTFLGKRTTLDDNSRYKLSFDSL